MAAECAGVFLSLEQLFYLATAFKPCHYMIFLSYLRFNCVFNATEWWPSPSNMKNSKLQLNQ